MSLVYIHNYNPKFNNRICIESWKKWTSINNISLIVNDQNPYDVNYMPIRFQRWKIFDMLENSELNVKRILISDYDTYINENCENFIDKSVNLTTCRYFGPLGKLFEVKKIIKDNLFSDLNYDIEDHFNSGVVILTKEHKLIFDEFYQMYEIHKKFILECFNYYKNVDEIIISFLIKKFKINTIQLDYKYNMNNLHINELLNENGIIKDKFDKIYHFGGLANKQKEFFINKI